MRLSIATGVALSASIAIGAAQAPQEKAKNLMQDVVKIGCLRAWQPGPQDTTKMPTKVLGTYVLTPISADPAKATADLPTYVLIGGSTVNFGMHLDHKVEISGVETAAQMPPTVQETVAAPTQKPESKPDIKSMPSLTVRGLKMISNVCT
jgi:hypothetical protein